MIEKVIRIPLDDHRRSCACLTPLANAVKLLIRWPENQAPQAKVSLHLLEHPLMSMPWILSQSTEWCWNSIAEILYQMHYIVILVNNCLHGWPILQSGQGKMVLKFAHRTLEALVGSHFSHLMMICSSPISTGLPREHLQWLIAWNWTQSFSRNSWVPITSRVLAWCLEKSFFFSSMTKSHFMPFLCNGQVVLSSGQCCWGNNLQMNKGNK